MGYSRKEPCPACKEFKYGRLSGDICDDCKRMIKIATDMIGAMKRQANDGESVVCFGSESHYNEYIYLRSGSGHNIRDGFHKVIRCLVAGRSIVSHNKTATLLMGKTESYSMVYATLPKNLADALKDFYAMLGPLFEKEYMKGKSDGSNLLMRLATGDLSPNDFLKEEE